MTIKWTGRSCAFAGDIAALATWGALSWALLVITGCASSPSTSAVSATGSTSNSGVIGFLGSMGDKALNAVGLTKTDVPDASSVPDSALPDWRVNWRIFASDSLNVDDHGQPLALVLRLYKLKSPDAFLQASANIFGDPAKEKAALGDDLVAARELQLLPGQHYEATDKVARDARYVGVVALFRNPAPGHWRYAFSTPGADKTGLSLGAHACAMSVQVGEAIGQPASAVKSVAVPCPQ